MTSVPMPDDDFPMSRLETIGSTAELPFGTATYARVPGSNLLSSTVFNNGSSDVLTVSRSYDSLNRLESISSSSSSVPSVVKSFTYVYNDRDQRTKCTLADGSYWVYQYDTLGQVISGIKYDASHQPIPGCGFGYDFDDIGNRKTATSDLTGTAMYDPNTLNQYEFRTVPGIIPVIGTANADTVVKIHRKALGDGPAAFIVPDRTGNIFHKNIPVNNANGPVTEELDVYCHKHLPAPPAQEIAAKASRTVTVPGSPEEFTHDPDGNLTSDGLWLYTWDAENRLISATTNHANDANSVKLEFTYDYQSRRTSKQVYSWTGSAWQLDKTEKFVYDGWNCIAKFDASSTLQESYLWGEDLSGSLQGAGGVGGLLAVSTFSPQPSAYLPLYDGNGNIMAYIDAADGTEVATFEYDPFGRTIAATGTAPCAFRFSTKPLDTETGLYYYGYRYYSPEMGRWLSRDPIEERGGNNLYVTANNNLVLMLDYLGLESLCVTIYVSQPIPNSNAFRNGNYYGHAFVKVARMDSRDSFTLGFHPSHWPQLIMEPEKDQNGEIRDDKAEYWNVGTTFSIDSKITYDQIYQAAKGYRNLVGRYNLWTNNCTSFALFVARKAGIKLPPKIGRGSVSIESVDIVDERIVTRTITKENVLYPGQLGEHLMVINNISKFNNE